MTENKTPKLDIADNGYPILYNWKEFVDENTVAVIDTDQTTFISASVSESVSLKITHKTDDVEFRKYFAITVYPQKDVNKDKRIDVVKNGATCKNKTLFWGSGRKAENIGGILLDINIKRASKGLEPYKKENFELETIQTPEPVEHLYHIIKSSLKAELEYLGITKYLPLISGSNNFRDSLVLPKPYKFNRKNTIRPVLLKEAREYVIKYHNGQIINGMETDDAVCQYGYKGYQDFLKTGKFSYIIVSQDKDSYSTSSLIFNNHKDSGKYKHPIPHLVQSGVGDLFMTGTKGDDVKGYGVKWLAYQTLMGDWGTDGYGSYQYFNHLTFGEKSAYVLLKPCKTEQECLQAVVNKYKEWFPEPFTFEQKDVDGNVLGVIQSDWLSFANTVFLAAYMKRINNDSTTFEKLLKHFKVDY